MASCCCEGRYDGPKAKHTPHWCAASRDCACDSAVHQPGCADYAPPCLCGVYGCDMECPEGVAHLRARLAAAQEARAAAEARAAKAEALLGDMGAKVDLGIAMADDGSVLHSAFKTLRAALSAAPSAPQATASAGEAPPAAESCPEWLTVQCSAGPNRHGGDHVFSVPAAAAEAQACSAECRGECEHFGHTFVADCGPRLIGARNGKHPRRDNCRNWTCAGGKHHRPQAKETP